MKMHTTLRGKVLALLLLWLGVVGMSNALTIPAPGVNRGDIGTLSTSGETVSTATIGGAVFYTPVDHWFSFTLDQAMDLEIWTEFRSGSPMILSFYSDSDTGTPLTTVGGSPYSFVYDPVTMPGAPGFHPHTTLTRFLDETLAAGDYWLRVEADPYVFGEEMNFGGLYTVRISGTTVPLPPALLLFGSTLIGFFTLGWRWRV